MDHIFRYLTKISKGMLIGHGQGLMWGAIFTRTGRNADAEYRANVVKAFKKHCDELNILPYHVPVGGFMVSPVMDIDVGTIYEMGERLEQAVTRTMEEVNWEREEEATQTVETFSMTELTARLSHDYGCQPILHTTKSCTSCSTFVNRDVRTRFVNH
jgi:hypothetical protein